MKSHTLLATLALLILATLPANTSAQTGRIDTASLSHLSEKASQTLDVNIDESLIQLATKFLSDKDADQVKIKEIAKGLKGIYVKVFEFEKPGGYTTADVDSIRGQLRGTTWKLVLNIINKKEGNVEVYIMSSVNSVGGLAVIVADPNELAIVNLVGPVDLEKLSQLEGSLGIPDLDLEPKPKKN